MRALHLAHLHRRRSIQPSPRYLARDPARRSRSRRTVTGRELAGPAGRNERRRKRRGTVSTCTTSDQEACDFAGPSASSWTTSDRPSAGVPSRRERSLTRRVWVPRSLAWVGRWFRTWGTVSTCTTSGPSARVPSRRERSLTRRVWVRSLVRMGRTSVSTCTTSDQEACDFTGFRPAQRACGPSARVPSRRERSIQPSPRYLARDPARRWRSRRAVTGRAWDRGFNWNGGNGLGPASRHGANARSRGRSGSARSHGPECSREPCISLRALAGCK